MLCIFYQNKDKTEANTHCKSTILQLKDVNTQFSQLPHEGDFFYDPHTLIIFTDILNIYNPYWRGKVDTEKIITLSNKFALFLLAYDCPFYLVGGDTNKSERKKTVKETLLFLLVQPSETFIF